MFQYKAEREQRGIIVDEDAFALLVALKKMNDTILEGLKAVVFILENERQMSPQRRESLIVQIKGLIA